MADKNNKEIIIKKIKKGHKAHHGGAWKIAYADFVTAMMAFFLLMWLINVTNEETRKGIADYFTTTAVTFKKVSGAQGVMSGQNQHSPHDTNEAEENVEDMAFSRSNSESALYSKNDGQLHLKQKALDDDFEEDKQSKAQEVKVNAQTEDLDSINRLNSEDIDLSPLKKLKKNKLDKSEPLNKQDKKENTKDQPRENKANDEHEEQINQVLQEQKKNLKGLMKQLKDTFNSMKELDVFRNNLILELTDQGLRIQIMDNNKHEMFRTGDATTLKQTKDILRALGKVISKIPNRINITGHTDSRPYTTQKSYGNWELSSDRAHSARRELEDSGIDSDRFVDVVGKAAKEPFNKSDTTAPENRRVSITLLYLDSE